MAALLRLREVGYSDIERLEGLRSARHTDHYRRLAAMFAALPKVALTERHYCAPDKCRNSSSSEVTTEA